MIFNIVIGQNLESHDAPSAQTPPISSLKANVHLFVVILFISILYFYLFFLFKILSSSYQLNKRNSQLSLF